MSTPLKNKASLLLKDMIRAARLIFTDVTPAQLLTREATNGSRHGPDARTMDLVSRAAFEIDDFGRIVELLHKRLSNFEKKQWRKSYKALVMLEHLLVHGPRSVAPEFQSDKGVISEMGKFQYVDKEGFDWGVTVRQISERVIQLLEKMPLLQQERARARDLHSVLYELQDVNSKSESTKTQGTEDGSKENNVNTYIIPPDHLNDVDLVEPLKENVANRKLQGPIAKEHTFKIHRVFAPQVQEWDWEDGIETDSLLVHQEEEAKMGVRPFRIPKRLASASLLSVV